MFTARYVLSLDVNPRWLNPSERFNARLQLHVNAYSKIKGFVFCSQVVFTFSYDS